jgi:hypothetical protein
MKEHEILEKGKAILVRASTRAGLVSAAVQGLMAVAGPRTNEMDDKVERAFDVTADDFGLLLGDLLIAAANLSKEHKETYEDISFTLITDKQAKGLFVGRPANSFHEAMKMPTGTIEVAKNEGGEWETTIKLK